MFRQPTKEVPQRNDISRRIINTSFTPTYTILGFTRTTEKPPGPQTQKLASQASLDRPLTDARSPPSNLLRTSCMHHHFNQPPARRCQADGLCRLASPPIMARRTLGQVTHLQQPLLSGANPKSRVAPKTKNYLQAIESHASNHSDRSG